MAVQSNASGSSKPLPPPSWLYYYQNLYLPHVMIILGIPVFLVLYIPFVHLNLKTALLTLVFYLIGNIGITAGYHRLWTHKSYEASLPLRVFLAILGGAQLQWSIMWWATHHRAHHWYIDTDKDPYDSRKGFFFCHAGWLLGYTPKTWGPVNTADLKDDPVVLWQEKNYFVIATLGCFGLPTLIAHYGWNDWQGGLIYAGFLRAFLYLQVSSLTNSLAHSEWGGKKPYSDRHSAVNNIFLGVVNSGEGWHNFHHTFPTDFRNGIQWYEVDLSKWMIRLWCQLGLASNLVMVSDFEIERQILRVQNRGKDEFVEDDRRSLSTLPTMQWMEYISQANTGRCLVCINGVIHDISEFMGEHPGGRDLLHQVLANDGTAAFDEFHDHSPYARHILTTMRIAILKDGPESDFK